MATVNYRVSASGVGGTFSKTAQVIGDVGASVETTLAVAKSGTLTTRTSDTQGVVTTGAAHGWTTSDTVAVYWDGGVAHICTIGSTTSTTITFTAVAGDNLPTLNSAVRVCKTSDITAVFDDNDMLLFAMELSNSVAGVVGHCVIVDSILDDGPGFGLAAREPIVNHVAGGETAITGLNGVTKLRVSHDCTTQTSVFTALWLTDGT